MHQIKSSKQAVIRAFRCLLHGVIRLALRNGLTYNELSDICKGLYVDIAEKEYGINGRPTNSSRIALLSGLNRKEVKRIQTYLTENDGAPLYKNSHIADILSRWYNSPDYLDEKGDPKLLSFDQGDINFLSLVASSPVSTDMQPTTILRELKRSLTIEELDSGELKVLKRNFVPNYLGDPKREPEEVDAEKISQGCSMLVDHMNTVFYNLYNHIEDQPTRFELRATNTDVTKSQAIEFQFFVRTHGMEFLVKADDLLSSFAEENKKNPTGETLERTGIGMYLIYDPANKNKKQSRK